MLLGVILAYLLNNQRTFALLYRVVGHRWSPALLGLLLLGGMEFAPENLRGWPRLAVHITLMLLLGSLVIRQDNLFRPLLEFAPLARIGVISYGVYLYHMFIIDFLSRQLRFLRITNPHPVVLFFVATAVAIAVAEASFRFIEGPLLKVKERFSSSPVHPINVPSDTVSHGTVAATLEKQEPGVLTPSLETTEAGTAQPL